MIQTINHLKSSCCVIDAYVRSGSAGGISARSHFRATSGPVKVQVEHLSCSTIHVTHLEGILSKKNWTGLAGGVTGGQDPAEGFRRAVTLGPLLDP